MHHGPLKAEASGPGTSPPNQLPLRAAAGRCRTTQPRRCRPRSLWGTSHALPSPPHACRRTATFFLGHESPPFVRSAFLRFSPFPATSPLPQVPSILLFFSATNSTDTFSSTQKKLSISLPSKRTTLGVYSPEG